MRKVCSLLLAILIVASLAVPAFAASSVVTVKYDKEKPFAFEPGSGYHVTDLFDNFKNVMPGDNPETNPRMVEIITIENDIWNHDYIKVWMEAVPHDPEDNPLEYDEDFEETDGKDQPPVTSDRDETIPGMEEFLKELTIIIKDEKGNELYEGSPVGGPDKLYLGKISKNKDMDLTVELYVPIKLGNEFANRVGEVDWQFTVEALNYPRDNPKTGDYLIMGAVALLAVSGATLLILLIGKRKKKHN